ncbi:MAG: DUF2442 domain-containing protein [Parafilimonas sp.]
MNPRVQNVKCKDEKHLIVTFENGEQKAFDMSPYFIYPVFKPLKDRVFFNKAHVLYGTVAWNNEIDIDPDTLYLEGKLLS